jgi:hypothetical protein
VNRSNCKPWDWRLSTRRWRRQAGEAEPPANKRGRLEQSGSFRPGQNKQRMRIGGFPFTWFKGIHRPLLQRSVKNLFHVGRLDGDEAQGWQAPITSSAQRLVLTWIFHTPHEMPTAWSAGLQPALGVDWPQSQLQVGVSTEVREISGLRGMRETRGIKSSDNLTVQYVGPS